MKKINLYIHLGAEKTGSTFIQQILHKNRKDLIRGGLLFLSENLTWNGNETINHQAFFKSLTKLTPPQQTNLAKEKVSNWVNFSENRKVKNFLISWESAKIPTPFLRALAKSPFLEIHPIIYVRNQTQWIKSGWKQYGCKINGVNNLSDWANHAITNKFWENKINWKFRIQQIEKLFGKENVIVKSYDIEKAHLVDSFLDIFNLSVRNLSNLETANDYSNKPLRNDLVELVKHSKALLSEPYSEEFTSLFTYYLNEDAFIETSDKSYFLNASDSLKIQQHFYDSNKFIAENYFKLFVEDVFHFPDLPDTIAEYPQYTLDQFVATFVEILFKREQKLKQIEKKILLQLKKSAQKKPPTLAV